jgi:hypothetical protein
LLARRKQGMSIAAKLQATITSPPFNTTIPYHDSIALRDLRGAGRPSPGRGHTCPSAWNARLMTTRARIA